MNSCSDTPSQSQRYRPLRILRQVVAEPKRYTRPWYFAYLLLGIVTAGLVPVLLPLMMTEVSHQASGVAFVMGVYDLGLMTSLFWGVLAERRKAYRSQFFLGFLLCGIATAVFPFMHSMAGWMLAAFVLGAGSSGAATVASLLIVDFEPAAEWEPRIGLLQSFNGVGQVVGLLLAGAFSHGLFSAGLWIAAVLLVPALVLSRDGLPAATRRSGTGTHHLHRWLDMHALAVFPRVNLPAGIGLHFHAFNAKGLRRLPDAVKTPFGRFLFSWFMLALGVAAFFTYFPVMLEHSYGVNSHLSSVTYALVAAAGISLFILGGHWSTRFGALRVYQIGLWIRLAGFILLAIPLLVPVEQRFTMGLIGFSLVVIGWPLLSVAGTNLAAQLAPPASEGEAMGLFNLALSSATVIGAFASGPLLAAFGYKYIAISGVVGIVIASALGFGLKVPPNASRCQAPSDVQRTGPAA
ncbi:MAG: MFS transporter [Candidimonas sp.]|nr:MAG: MFS transporter [Candidimonas sp.]TAM24121.1 MAG: MFS transporter [Candidimonas sp.]TAM76851.1 MAG: MFS transporter [Candidimonas sp.]